MISTISPLIQETIKYSVQAGGTPAIGILNIKKELDRFSVSTYSVSIINTSLYFYRNIFSIKIGDMRKLGTDSFEQVHLLKDDAIQGAFSKRVTQALQSLQAQTGQLSSS